MVTLGSSSHMVATFDIENALPVIMPDHPILIVSLAQGDAENQFRFQAREQVLDHHIVPGLTFLVDDVRHFP